MEKYTKAQMEVIEFENEDVITESIPIENCPYDGGCKVDSLAFDGACAAGRDDILVLKLDDFHLSLCILFHVYTPPFAENFYVKQLLRRITQRVNSPGEVLPHRSALFSAMRCRFFA